MKLGKDAEDYVCSYLKKHGAEIVKQNYFCRFGEIDIIAKTIEYIIFVEVKMRGLNPLVSGEEAVSYTKQKKIIKAAEFFLVRFEEKLQPRFDVASVCKNESGKFSVEYYKNAFDAEGTYI